jgi:hypothetical protein
MVIEGEEIVTTPGTNSAKSLLFRETGKTGGTAVETMATVISKERLSCIRMHNRVTY